MATSGRNRGTVNHWDPATRTGLIDLPDFGGPCHVPADVVDAPPQEHLRAGQVVDVEWVDDEQGLRATRVRLRPDLEQGPGG